MIAIGCDHAGIHLKQKVLAHLMERRIAYHDVGTEEGIPADYPVIATKVTDAIKAGDCERGILICGTGIGMNIAANKARGIRAAVCHDTFSVRMMRMHNDANVLCIGERVIGEGLAMDIVDLFLDTAFEGGRHQRRVDLMMQIKP